VTSITEENSPRLLLGIEGGGTRSTAALANLEGRILRSLEFGPGNLRLLDDKALERFFRNIAEAFPKPLAIGVGLAGLRNSSDHARVAKLMQQIWPGIPFRANHDLEIALLAGQSESATNAGTILVLSGTGSCCYGRARDGKTIKLGGWGHILGDKGSGYEIGLRALKACVFYYDRDAVWSRLGQRILAALVLNEPEELIVWVQNATKADIGILAAEVFAAARERDSIARDILEGAAHSLARDAITLANKLSRNKPIEFIFAGSVLQKQPAFARKLSSLIRKARPESHCSVPKSPTISGAIKLAAQVFHIDPKITLKMQMPPGADKWVGLADSPTEQRNPRSMHLDRMPVKKAVQLMLSEDTSIPIALAKHSSEIERIIVLIARCLSRGGRLFYVGAGTSGRLGVLDASECPPTFGTARDQIQGIIAGGQRALWQSIEGAEDDPASGARAIELRGARPGDVVVGIAASGRTPFVWGALEAAKKRRSSTVIVCFNPHVAIPVAAKPTIVLAVDVGPEVLTGSTRLKAGTATKLLLNIFTTLSMVRLGKVVGNLMVDLNPSNVKLRDRATRIAVELTGCKPIAALRALEECAWNLKKALKVLQPPKRTKTNAKRGVSSKTGRAKLRRR
jgi:N-acetylmuramic acid 6-phosphate etherase